MKKINIAINIIIIAIVLLTPKKFYNGYYEFLDYLILFISIANLILIFPFRKKVPNQRIPVITSVLSLLYLISTAYLYSDGDWNYKGYRLQYVNIRLSNDILFLLQNVSFYILITLVIVQVTYIFLFIKNYRK
jgi:hypothetical protein